MASQWKHLVSPLIASNPVTLQILGICSALAVTTSLQTALVMSAALTGVLVMASAVISLIRRHIPNVIRLIVQIVIIASLVVVIDELLQAFVFEISRELSIFVGLIVTNCLVLGRAEAFAMRNPVWPSMLDGLGNGLGYSLVLVIVGTVRELFGQGTLMGITILTPVSEGGWFEPFGLMQLAPSGFFVIAALIWVIRSVRTEQVEAPEHSLARVEARR